MTGRIERRAASGERILVTGVTGWVADPIATALATDDEVVGAARFRDSDPATCPRRSTEHR